MPITVALVDDDPAMRERVGEAIALDPQLSLMASFADARSMLAWLETSAPDVLLVDLGLPDTPGLAVISYCAQRHPATHIMVLTVFADEQSVLLSIKAGASGYLLKDSLHEEIVALIRQLHAGGAPMTPRIARQLLGHLRPDNAPPKATAALDFHLTRTEHEVLNLISRGFKYAEVAAMKQVSINTVHTHIRSIYSKLSVNSRSEAVFEAGQLGLLDGMFRRHESR
jgi:DNA-binding NarL/FixJ family response regulator